MQEDSGSRRLTQPGRPASQLQIRRHDFRLSRHSPRLRPLRSACGRGTAMRHVFAINLHGPCRARPVDAMVRGVVE